MADGIIEYTNAVKDLLASLSFDAEVSFIPDYSLPDMKVKRCVVVPINIEEKIIGRSVIEKNFRVDIALLNKVKKINEIPELIRNIESVANAILGKRILGGNCITAEFSPLYAVDMILQKNLFVGVIAVSIKVAS